MRSTARVHDPVALPLVYAVHESIGHLGIFVSGSVAKKEHDQFASNIDMIDALPPGLYEAVMAPKNPNDPAVDLITGDYLVRFEARTLDDIRALGGNNSELDKEFAAVARVSEINLGLYRTFVQPWIRMWANEGVAEWMRRFHPLRLQYEIFSQANPFMRPLLSNLEWARENRQPVSKDNPFWQAQEWLGHWIETSLDGYRDVRDNTSEALFHAIYGSPLVQALVGLKASDEDPRHRPAKDAPHLALVTQRIKELKDRIPEGGAREAVIRTHAGGSSRRAWIQFAAADAGRGWQRPDARGFQGDPAGAILDAAARRATGRRSYSIDAR